MEVDIRSNPLEWYRDWLIIAVKTDPKIVTYSFLAISPCDDLFHVDREQYQSASDALSVARVFVDLEEMKVSARGMP